MTEPIRPERQSLAPDGLEQDLEQDGPERDSLDLDRRRERGAETEPESRGPDADATAPDVSSSADAPGDACRPSDGPVPTEPVADDPEAANEQVAATLAELDAAADWPPSDQVAAFSAAHETLQATLARIDDH